VPCPRWGAGAARVLLTIIPCLFVKSGIWNFKCARKQRVRAHLPHAPGQNPGAPSYDLLSFLPACEILNLELQIRPPERPPPLVIPIPDQLGRRACPERSEGSRSVRSRVNSAKNPALSFAPPDCHPESDEEPALSLSKGSRTGLLNRNPSQALYGPTFRARFPSASSGQAFAAAQNDILDASVLAGREARSVRLSFRSIVVIPSEARNLALILHCPFPRQPQQRPAQRNRTLQERPLDIRSGIMDDCGRLPPPPVIRCACHPESDEGSRSDDFSASEPGRLIAVGHFAGAGPNTISYVPLIFFQPLINRMINPHQLIGHRPMITLTIAGSRSTIPNSPETRELSSAEQERRQRGAIHQHFRGGIGEVAVAGFSRPKTSPEDLPGRLPGDSRRHP